MSGNPLVTQNPVLLINQISDQYLRKNFQNLQAYFQANNQLLGFNFYEISVTKATSNLLVAHGLNYIPLDVIVTQCSGPGTVTFNYGLFDKTNVNITTTDAARVRFFVGTYYNQQSSVNANKTDAQSYNVSAEPATAAATTGFTPRFYSGYQVGSVNGGNLNTVYFANSGAAYGDFYADNNGSGPLKLVDQQNYNFTSIVGQYTTPITQRPAPGITFNWPATGYYEVRCSGTLYMSTHGEHVISLTDGSLVFDEGEVYTGAATDMMAPFSLVGLFKVTDITKVQTVKTQGWSNAGVLYMYGNIQALCYWKIKKIADLEAS